STPIEYSGQPANSPRGEGRAEELKDAGPGIGGGGITRRRSAERHRYTPERMKDRIRRRRQSNGPDRVQPAAHHREVEPAIARDGGLQLGHDDDEMIDALQHQARFFLKKAIVRSHASFAAASL